MSTDIENLSVSALGFSFGMNTWLNIFGKQNVGIKTEYNYDLYNNRSIFKSDISGHSVSFSLIYMFPKRDTVYKKYY